MAGMKGAKDLKEIPFDNPLNGRFIHPGVEDPIKIGETDFQELVNMRYTSMGIRGISCMTKMNSNALPYNNVLDGAQFNKYLPVPNSTDGLAAGAFSYNIAQVTDGVSSSAIVRSNNTVAVSNPDTYSTLVSGLNYGPVEMSVAPDGAFAVCDGATNWIWGGDEFRCSAFIFNSGATLNAAGFQDFTQQVNNSLTDALDVAVIPFKLFHPASVTAATFYVGSIRPLSGIKLYISTPNTVGGTTVVVNYVTNAGPWQAVSNLVDGTVANGTSLGQTGEITFTSTDGSAVPWVINGEMLYWYQVSFTNAGATTQTVNISSCTLLAAVQSVKDIWDGIDRAEASFLTKHSDGSITDYSAVVVNNTYPAFGTTSGAGYYYVDFSDFADTSAVYIGFSERMQAIKFNFASSLAVGSLSATLQYLDTVNGWTDVTFFEDGTDAFCFSGTMSWIPPAASSEKPTQIQGGPSDGTFYYYRLSFSGEQPSPGPALYYVAGIPCPTVIQPHTIPVLWQDRLWLLCNLQGHANEALYSSAETNCIFNGTDSSTLSLGDNTPILAAGALYSRYGGSIYDDLIVVKAYQTYLIDGTSPETWTVYTIAPNVGITAAKTFTICDTGYELAPGLTKHIGAWVSASGPVMFDGNGIIPIEMDIGCFWNPDSPYYVAPSVMALASAWYDSIYREWHLAFDGMEWVYDVSKKKWWQANRGTGKALVCGWMVKDGNGFSYNYAGTSTGEIECLENGTTMDGNPITYAVRVGDTPPAKSGMIATQIRRVKMIARTKAYADTLTFNWYGDGCLTPTQIHLLDQSTQNGKYRIYQAVMGNGPDVEMEAVFHSFEMLVTTTDEMIGFEPIMISATWEMTREDVYGRY